MDIHCSGGPLTDVQNIIIKEISQEASSAVSIVLKMTLFPAQGLENYATPAVEQVIPIGIIRKTRSVVPFG